MYIRISELELPRPDDNECCLVYLILSEVYLRECGEGYPRKGRNTAVWFYITSLDH
jgi:hypothetical protein